MIRVNKILIFSPSILKTFQRPCIVSKSRIGKTLMCDTYLPILFLWNRGFWGSEKFFENTNLSAVETALKYKP